MLSILIPVYNFDVVPFVGDLHQQALEAGVAFEIRCYDDASDQEFKTKNTALSQFEKVIYLELEQNLGRSAIRNKLASEAVYDYIFFADCDSSVGSKQFLQRYIGRLKPGVVLYGGRDYTVKPPADPNRYFRWYYGTQRETISAKVRAQHPYRSFMTNNFLMSRSDYLSIQLNEDLKGYGHEDTLFGKELKQRQIPVHHFDNPLTHIGLETVDEFLAKTEEGICNLAYLIREELVDEEIRLYKYYQLVKKLRSGKVIRTLFKARKKRILNNLHSSHPNLQRFDFYKLGLLFDQLED